MIRATTDQHEAEVLQIQAAAERLLAGTPMSSSGRLSIVALADEAGIKRSRLYDHHRDLVDAFLNRAQGRHTSDHAILTAELAHARATIKKLQQQVADQAAHIQALTAAAVELSLLNASDNVTPINTRLHATEP